MENKPLYVDENVLKTETAKAIIELTERKKNKQFEQLISDLKKDFNECRDKTDIWDSERWNKFEKMFINKLKERVIELENAK